MLFKSLGYSTSLFNLGTITILVYSGTAFKIGTPHWNIGIGSILLSFFSIGLFYLNKREDGLNALKAYSLTYATLGLIGFCYVATNNLINSLAYEDFKNFLIIFSAMMCISIVANFSVESGGNYKVLKIVSNILSILTLGITFGTVYKYVFLGIDVEFAILFIDLFMIGLGSALFIGFHHYAEKNK